MQAHGFTLVREQEIEELSLLAQLWRHDVTQAQLLSLQSSDTNKVFGISFRTPPTDSTGLPHIMEHAVLGGSRKYPLKEPFVELIKGSLNTFLNAWTMPDHTSYPVASQNLRDFYNLVDVYLDAVLDPLISPNHLRQEGWHYELDEDGRLAYRGIVFNEMKGAYSSPDMLLYRESTRTLFPDNTYGVDSGGDPRHIPDLTYEQFKEFHDTYYHPSNALIYFYGDDDPDERLRLINARLAGYGHKDVAANVPLHAPFSAPRRVVDTYPVEPDGAEPKAMVQLNWALPEVDGPATEMALSVLSYCLMSTQASPLRKTLLDANLGEDLTGGGLGEQMRQLTFGVGMKGVAADDVAKVEQLITTTLEAVAEEGFDSELIEAALNTFEFSLRENNTGSFPQGLLHMVRALSSWVYDGDPFEQLAFEAPLAETKARLSADPAYLQKLLRRYLLENHHRATVVLAPDPEMAGRLEADERARLDAFQATLGESELAAIRETVSELETFQAMTDSPAALATLPRLGLADLDRQGQTIPSEIVAVGDSQVYYHDIFANGIIYVDLAFDWHALPAQLAPYGELLRMALLRMGTTDEDYVQLSQRIGRKTGGISTGSFASSRRGQTESVARLIVQGKATAAQTTDMMQIISDVFLKLKLDDSDRMRQILSQSKSRREASLIPGGHSVVNRRLRSHFSESGWLEDNTDGVDALLFIRDLYENFSERWPELRRRLVETWRILLNRQSLAINVTTDRDSWRAFRPTLAAFLADLPTAPPEAAPWSGAERPSYEGLSLPAQVNYVGKAANINALGYHRHGSLSVITNFLRTGWLWNKIRAQGGAYSAFCQYDHHAGMFSYVSYRDPNLQETLATYDATGDYLRQVELSADEVVNNIIGAIGSIDGYRLPDALGYTSFLRQLLGVTDEERQRYREQLLDTTVADIRAFAAMADAVRREGDIVVLGAAEALAAVDPPLTMTRLL